jgi:hypothetical protein
MAGHQALTILIFTTGMAPEDHRKAWDMFGGTPCERPPTPSSIPPRQTSVEWSLHAKPPPPFSRRRLPSTQTQPVADRAPSWRDIAP